MSLSVICETAQTGNDEQKTVEAVCENISSSWSFLLSRVSVQVSIAKLDARADIPLVPQDFDAFLCELPIQLLCV